MQHLQLLKQEKQIENLALKNLPMAIMIAHKQYCSQASSAPPAPPGQSQGADAAAAPIVVFVVQPGEVNTVDQRLLEHELWSTFKIRAVRKTMAEIDATGELKGLRHSVLEVAVARGLLVALRSGPAPATHSI